MLQKGMQIHTCFENRETSIFDDPSMQKPLFSYPEGSDFHLFSASFLKCFAGISQNLFFRPFGGSGGPTNARI